MKTRQSIKKEIWQLGCKKKRKKQTGHFLPAIAKIASAVLSAVAQKILDGGKGRNKRRRRKRKQLTVLKNMK